jgi:choloylglycine hydrolase
VITNSPPFDWHLTNLKYYIHLTPFDELPRDLCGEIVTPTGRGSGMLGLPGDFTPPSRFIRASYFKDSVVPAADATEAVLQLFHIMNQFDIPRGVVNGFNDGQQVMERTDWTSSADLANRRYYIHTADTRCIHMIDLMQSPVNSEGFINIPLPEEEIFVDLTPIQNPVP